MEKRRRKRKKLINQNRSDNRHIFQAAVSLFPNWEHTSTSLPLLFFFSLRFPSPLFIFSPLHPSSSPLHLLLFIFSSSSSHLHLLLFIFSSSSSPLHLLIFIFSSSSSPLHLLLFIFSSSSSHLHLLLFIFSSLSSPLHHHLFVIFAPPSLLLPSSSFTRQHCPLPEKIPIPIVSNANMCTGADAIFVETGAFQQ
jgi:hypothetical protein